jgi:hypothetical protein
MQGRLQCFEKAHRQDKGVLLAIKELQRSRIMTNILHMGPQSTLSYHCNEINSMNKIGKTS